MVGVVANRDVPPAPGEERHPALALVNSRRLAGGEPVDELGTVPRARRWTRAHGLGEGVRRASDAAELRRLRDAVRDLLEARMEGREPGATALEAVNAAASPNLLRLAWDADGPRAVRERPGADGLARSLAVLAGDAMELVTGPEHALLHQCGAPDCIRLLLRDHARRTWCSTRCGDRVRASRYYRRRHHGQAT